MLKPIFEIMVIMMRAGGGVFLFMVMSMVNIVMAIMTVMAMATALLFCDDGYSYKDSSNTDNNNNESGREDV